MEYESPITAEKEIMALSDSKSNDAIKMNCVLHPVPLALLLTYF